MKQRFDEIQENVNSETKRRRRRMCVYELFDKRRIKPVAQTEICMLQIDTSTMALIAYFISLNRCLFTIFLSNFVSRLLK